MTEEQKEFLKLAKEYESLKEQMSKVSEGLQAALAKLPLNSYLQDPETSLVYKTVVPNGRFVYYQALDYVRTAKPDERSGTLSKKEAQSLGFVLA